MLLAQKKVAVDREDFAEAKQFKVKIDKKRNDLFNDLRVEELLEQDGQVKDVKIYSLKF